jgi:hypothetical protein
MAESIEAVYDTIAPLLDGLQPPSSQDSPRAKQAWEDLFGLMQAASCEIIHKHPQFLTAAGVGDGADSEGEGSQPEHEEEEQDEPEGEDEDEEEQDGEPEDEDEDAAQETKEDRQASLFHGARVDDADAFVGAQGRRGQPRRRQAGAENHRYHFARARAAGRAGSRNRKPEHQDRGKERG